MVDRTELDLLDGLLRLWVLITFIGEVWTAVTMLTELATIHKLKESRERLKASMNGISAR